jgi:uncharacterized protein YbbK (DUF523 family)
LGKNCRYDGRNCLDRKLLELLRQVRVIGVCPEELGGLRGRRGPFELKGKAEDVFVGKAEVLSRRGRVVTKNFLKGAHETLKIAKRNKADLAIFKSRSPACSPDFVYNGTFTRKLVKGQGVTAWFLKRHGIRVISNQEFKRQYRIKGQS